MKQSTVVNLLIGFLAGFLVFAALGQAMAHSGVRAALAAPAAVGTKPPGGADSAAPSGAPAAVGVGPGFTYQGQLKQSGGPVNQHCDFQFSVWDTPGSGTPPTGGTQIGLVQQISNVAVTNGLFTVRLNNGDEIDNALFTGDERWLGIAVRCPTGSGVFTPLGPRQLLTAAPYALGLRPGAIVSGAASTGFTSISTAAQGTGLIGKADNGANAWGVEGVSASGIGVLAKGGDDTSTPNVALQIDGGALKVGGAVRPAFVFTPVVVSSDCSNIIHPLLDNDPDAIILVTPRRNGTSDPVTDFKVIYTSGSGLWSLCALGLTGSMQYNILVINQ